LSSDPLTPNAPEQRLLALDALRGLALFGVLVVNLVMGFRISIFQQLVEPHGLPEPLDDFAEAFVRNVFELKAYALFSLLFGMGLAAQHERLQALPHPRYWLARRLAILSALGAIHLIFIWNGDILLQYAIAGFMVLPFVGASLWALGVASSAMLLVYFFMPLLPIPVSWPSPDVLERHVAEASQVFPTQGYVEIRRFSWDELALLLPLHVYIFPRTLGLMLLGVLGWRIRWLSLIRTHTNFSLVTSFAAIVAGASFTIITAPPAAEIESLPGVIRYLAPGAGPVLLAMGYAGLFVGAIEFPSIWRAARFLAPTGRMAFTNYIMQSVVMGWIFFGYGLGLYNQMGAAAGLALAIAIFAAQVVFSTWWLKHWRFGPIEWLWRSLMYGKAQPMRVFCFSK